MDYAHLSYYPNSEESAARTSYRLQNEELPKTLPDRFPAQLNSKMVWDRESLSIDEHESNDGTDCVLALDEEQLAEIDAAVKHFEALHLPPSKLDTSTFPLPTLHPILRRASQNIHSSHGFTLLRNIPVDNYTRAQNIIIYVGLASHIGPVFGRQDHQYAGEPADVMMAHITDFRKKDAAADEKKFSLAAYTDGEVIFHTDVGDIVSLFVLGEPVEGGESLVASGGRVYNELARTRPDLVRVLAEEWLIPSAKNDTIHQRPLLFYQPPTDKAPERVIIQFSRRSFSGFGNVPQSKYLTAAQAEALDALHFLADEFHISMKLRKGDIQYINNLAVLHARRNYVDDSEHRRHLLRLWMRDPENAWTTPEEMRERWGRIYGAEASNGPEVFPLEAATRSVGEQGKDTT
ncbi:TauD/TfdA family dioxygenase [Aspergillus glaucus CBS 516.65]|uniref:TauD/TfdA-like domain-containing protein n=1 Tax=Aspergillus glaucus CBS 516.65 TaxID=1160497 RepID=A0A1L9VM95_ASPGL|nr:hypothetical protein ASPGLDRAFT_124861 [Aspergillus glaucus CBS 516.65]OJJ84992.1 hypothetical protein ASPGLDRAFT_124861 [Aspergillus glaucus CBS 516.65]